MKNENVDYDVIIIGSGIAGLSASIYTSRGGYETLVLHGNEPGGQLTLTSEVANYPGFPQPVGGQELIDKMKEQAISFGSETKFGTVSNVLKNDTGIFTIELNNDENLTSKSVIVASGASARTLEVPGEDDLMGYGVSTCATCDGAFFRDEKMAVVGGGDAAFEEAHFLTKFAEKVYLIHRRSEYRANKHLQTKVNKKVKKGEIEILDNTEVKKINGSKEEGINSLSLISHPDGLPSQKNDSSLITEDELDVNAVFIAIGHTPNTQFLKNLDVKLTEDNYIVINEGFQENSTGTGVEGLFAAGDVVDSYYQQAATASGLGVKAALDVEDYLSHL